MGDNDSGQLGDGTNVPKTTPVAVVGLPGAATAVAASYGHSLALLADGTIWAWGDNIHGQLGYTTTNVYLTSNIPNQVVGIPGLAIDIAAGYTHSLAVLQDGSVWAWGSDSYGETGIDYAHSLTPHAVAGLPAKAMAVAGGSGFSLALLNDGTVWAWGADEFQELANPTVSVQSSKPVQVTGFTGKVVAVTANGNELSGHSLALLEDGSVWAWGRNDYGQLGTGNNQVVYTATKVLGLPAPAVAMAVGDGHSLVLLNDGTVWGWGDNSMGELGVPVESWNRVPAKVIGLP